MTRRNPPLSARHGQETDGKDSRFDGAPPSGLRGRPDPASETVSAPRSTNSGPALLFELGGLLLFWGCDALGLARYAPMATVAFVTADGLRRWRGRLGFPPVWRLLNGLALGLAALDAIARATAWTRYESTAIDAVIAGVFAIGATGARPLVQEIAEQRQGAPFPPERRDLTAFFRAYTWVWAAYFAGRAGAWMWMTRGLPVARAHALQDVIGPVSLLAMILVSFRGKALFRALCRWGLFRT